MFGVAVKEVASSGLASCVPNSGARGEDALLAILVYFEGAPKIPPPRRDEGSEVVDEEKLLRRGSK